VMKRPLRVEAGTTTSALPPGADIRVPVECPQIADG